MARPKKDGLDYFPFDVGFFLNRKIRRLHAKFHNNGIVVYIYLLCVIYQNGYYIDLDEDLILDISDAVGISENCTRQIVNYLFSRSLLFNDILAKSVKVLTAASIQRRYQEAKKGGKRDIEVDGKLWVLKNEETLGCIRVRSKKVNSEINASFSGKNGNKSENYDTKESKVKESKDTYLLTSGNQPENLSTVSTNPTFKEVVACIEDNGGGVNAQKFYNYYSSRGWKDKNGVPIDLKTSVIHWQNTEGKFKAKPKSKSESVPESPMAEAYKSLVYNIDE